MQKESPFPRKPTLNQSFKPWTPTSFYTDKLNKWYKVESGMWTGYAAYAKAIEKTAIGTMVLCDIEGTDREALLKPEILKDINL